MKASEFFPSNYLNAESARELNGKTLTIYEVKSEIIRDDEKMLIGFESVEKTLVVNKTNATTLIKEWGDETNGWIGKSIVLEIVKVMFKGERTDSIMITPITDRSLPTAAQVLGDAASTGIPANQSTHQSKKAKK
jgi:hypothetical protein